MASDPLVRGAVLAATLVFASSFLGLNGTGPFNDDNDDPVTLGQMWRFFTSVWASSAAADVVFVVGTLAAGVGTYLWARRPGDWSFVGGLVVGFPAHAVVYAVSFLQLLHAEGGEVRPPLLVGSGRSFAVLDDPSFMNALRFVVPWGVVGLVCCALAPPIAARARRSSAPRVVGAHRSAGRPAAVPSPELEIVVEELPVPDDAEGPGRPRDGEP